MGPPSPLIFSCSHPATAIPLNNPPIRTYPDGVREVAGLCRTCHYHKCRENYELVRQYWQGRIEDLQRRIRKASSELRYNFDEFLANWMDEAERRLDAYGREMEMELGDVWVDYENRWGRR